MPTPATSAAPDQGWLYDLLRWAGVGESSAAHVQQVIVKPVTLVIVLLAALLIGWLGNRLIRHWIGAAVRRAAARSDSPRAERRAVTLTAMLANIWRVVVAVIAVLVGLGTVGINLTPLLAGATVIGATIGFGAQAMVRDLLAGFLMAVEGQFDIGDTITVNDTSGVVEDLTLRVTRLRAPDGAVWFLANGEIRKLANVTRGWGRATVDVPVPPSADFDEVLGAVHAAADAVYGDERYSAACLDAPVVWGVTATAVDSLTTRVTIRTTAGDRDRVERALREQVARRLREAGVFAPP